MVPRFDALFRWGALWVIVRPGTSCAHRRRAIGGIGLAHSSRQIAELQCVAQFRCRGLLYSLSHTRLVAIS